MTSLCGFGHAFQLNSSSRTYPDLVILSRCGVNPGLSDPPVRTADTDILVASAETPCVCPLKWVSTYQGVVVGSMAAY